VSLDPAALLCLWRDVMGHWPAEKKNEKLASKCCTNVRNQHLSQNDVVIVRPIDFDPWFEPMHALPSMNSLLKTAKLRLLHFAR